MTTAISLLSPFCATAPIAPEPIAPEPIAPEQIDVWKIRQLFPVLNANSQTLFFDNASTAQKPQAVIDAINSFNSAQCANAGRGNYSWATRLSSAIENARDVMAKFLNTSRHLVAFTNGATDSLNIVANSWGLLNLEDGDEVMVCLDDHRSAVLPWLNLQSILAKMGKSITIVPFQVHPSGTYDRNSIIRGLSKRTRLIALCHIHHVYGMEMDIAELQQLIPDSVLISLDASQSVAHIEVNAGALGVDFISFSGHKMFAGNGAGVLWTSARALPELWPMRVGAKTNISETAQGLILAPDHLAGVTECGTLNIPSILSLAQAVKFIEGQNRSAVEAHVSALTRQLLGELKALPGIVFAPGIGACDCTRGYGIVSFRFADVKTADVGAFLDSEEIFVRTGDHCQAQLSNLSDSSNLSEQSSRTGDEFIRVSLQIYNTSDEVRRFVEVLRDACC